jgi:hypothetical protein
VLSFSDACGLAGTSGLLDAIVGWQERCWRGTEARAAAGDPVMTRLRDGGAARQVRAAHDWTAARLGAVSAQLRRPARSP